MHRLPHLLFILILLAVGQASTAQISHGGEPWMSGARPSPFALPVLDLDALQAEDEVLDKHKDIPWRYGVEHAVNWNASSEGLWSLEHGQMVWRLVIAGDGATCLAVRFSSFRIPKGGQLFLYAADGSQSIGAFDHRNMKEWGGLSTDLIMSDEVVVEYRQPLNASSAPELVIDQVIQGYRALVGWFDDPSRGPGDSGDCNINVNCPEGAPWATEKRSVALILAGGGICTGALVNNTANDGTPYFLTANHCLGNPQNWVYRFNFDAAACDGINGPTNQSVSGGTLLVSSSQSDFALLELSQTPPDWFDVQYAGWDATGTVPLNTVGIHHPSGDVKKICFDEDSPSQAFQGGANVWYLDEWELGVTEGGSSGSPLFDQNHRIIGQLYGGYAACQGSVNNGGADWYGRFDFSWGLGLQEYLDPLGTGFEIWDGFPDGAAVYNNDAGVNITDAPEGTLCNAGQVDIEVTITNTGQNTLTSCMLQYTINNGPMQQQSWAGSLAPFESDQVLLPPFSAQGGVNVVQVNVITPNGVTDENSLNNQTTAEFTASEGPTFNYTFELVLDDYGSETTWTLKKLGQVLYEGGPYTDGTDGEVISLEFCLEEGCYQFRIEDDYEDGICCGYGEGSWSISDPNGDIVGSGGEFTAFESVVFCADASLSIAPIEQHSLVVYPVPTSSIATAQLPGTRGELRVVDVVGRVMVKVATQDANATFDTSSWPEGTYFIEWFEDSGNRSVAKMLVVR